MAANNGNRSPRRRSMAEINIVPYIDVMLVLLVIFMVTAPLLTQGVQVELPKISSKPIPPQSREPLIVTVDAKGRYFLNIGDGQGKALAPEVLQAKVSTVLRLQPQTPVLVRGDAHVDYGKVVDLMSLLQQAGAPNVGLITEPPEASGRSS